MVRKKWYKDPEDYQFKRFEYYDNSNHIKTEKKYRTHLNTSRGVFGTKNFYYTKRSKHHFKYKEEQIPLVFPLLPFERNNYQEGINKGISGEIPYGVNEGNYLKKHVRHIYTYSKDGDMIYLDTKESFLGFDGLHDKHDPFNEVLGHELRGKLSYKDRKIMASHKAIFRKPKRDEVAHWVPKKRNKLETRLRREKLRDKNPEWIDSNGNLNYKEATKRIHSPKYYRYNYFLNPDTNPYLKQPSINEGVKGFWITLEVRLYRKKPKPTTTLYIFTPTTS